MASTWTCDLRPRDVCRALLQALEPAQGLVRRRRRDQTPDQVGLSIKRGLLLRAVEDDPAAAEFEAWLARQGLMDAAERIRPRSMPSRFRALIAPDPVAS